MNRVVENLKLAKALISDPDNWIKDEYALDSCGNPTLGKYETAVCFCSMGAIQRVCSTMFEETTEEAKVLNHAAYTLCDGNAADYNDSHTHDEVMAMWDLAIRLAEEEYSN